MSAKQPKFLCTHEEFDAIKKYTEMDSERLAAIQRILIYGTSQKEEAAALGIHKQSINRSVVRVKALIESYRVNSCRPPGWRTITITAPMRVIRLVKREVQAALKELETKP